MAYPFGSPQVGELWKPLHSYVVIGNVPCPAGTPVMIIDRKFEVPVCCWTSTVMWSGNIGKVRDNPQLFVLFDD